MKYSQAQNIVAQKGRELRVPRFWSGRVGSKPSTYPLIERDKKIMLG